MRSIDLILRRISGNESGRLSGILGRKLD